MTTMINSIWIRTGILFLCFVSNFAFAEPIKKLTIVTTISTFADIAASVGGEYVETSSIASPRFNTHFIEPKPTDVLRLKRADLFIHGGLDLEMWRDPLVNASGRPDFRVGGERQLDVSSSVTLLDLPSGPLSRASGDIHLYGNPHYWQDPKNGLAIAETISNKLKLIDPAHSGQYDLLFEKFKAELEAKIQDWQKLVSSMRKGEILAYHNEWVYLANFMQIQLRYFLEPKPGVPPGPQHLEFLKQHIVSEKIPGIIQASYYPKTSAEFLARETEVDLKILCQNVKELESCSNYISMLDYNIKSIGALF